MKKINRAFAKVEGRDLNVSCVFFPDVKRGRKELKDLKQWGQKRMEKKVAKKGKAGVPYDERPWWTIQAKPDKRVNLDRETIEVNPKLVVKASATLENRAGGKVHIIREDHCYVLVISGPGQPYHRMYHWFPEAVEALKKLPALKRREP